MINYVIDICYNNLSSDSTAPSILVMLTAFGPRMSSTIAASSEGTGIDGPPPVGDVKTH